MTLLALAGWAAAVVTLIAAFAGRRRCQARFARIAEAEHELRGPLTALGFAIDGLGKNGHVGPDALRAELGRARCAVADLTAARTGRPSLLPTPTVIDLGAVVRSSVAAWQPAAMAAGVELCAAPVATIRAVGDPSRLAQATGNLIANAIEHGGGRVQVSVSSAGAHARVEVADAGPGLPYPVRALRHRGHAGTHGHGLRVARGWRPSTEARSPFRPARLAAPSLGLVVALTLPLPSSG